MNLKNQTGRSMIEMLGVLAITGVLSVGGLAGYSKAMIKFKTNKTIDEIITIATNIQTLFANQKTYEGTAVGCGNNGTEICKDEFNTNKNSDLEFLKNAGVFPEDMIVDNKLINPFNGNVWISSWSPKYLFIVFENLPKEACTTLATYDWGNSSSGYVGLNVVTTDWGNTTPMDCYPGYDRTTEWDSVKDGELSACTWDKKIPHPVPPEIAAQGCNCRSNTCKISVQFDEYRYNY
ncbi:MAG: hypothetical protein Q4D80_06145 [Pseudomonadota bacterium]|nr:hypothetical protein [Pseudomonadota bacterium]